MRLVVKLIGCCQEIFDIFGHFWILFSLYKTNENQFSTDSHRAQISKNKTKTNQQKTKQKQKQKEKTKTKTKKQQKQSEVQRLDGILPACNISLCLLFMYWHNSMRITQSSFTSASLLCVSIYTACKMIKEPTSVDWTVTALCTGHGEAGGPGSGAQCGAVQLQPGTDRTAPQYPRPQVQAGGHAGKDSSWLGLCFKSLSLMLATDSCFVWWKMCWMRSPDLFSRPHVDKRLLLTLVHCLFSGTGV